MAHILIVDDEAGIRESLRGILEEEGYKTSVSPSGEDCLELLRKTSFDLILLDVWLTGIDGLEVLEKIRRWSARTSGRLQEDDMTIVVIDCQA